VLVATAAYVWWKRRDHVAAVETVPAPTAAPVAAAWSAPAPAATSVAVAEPAPFDLAVEAEPIVDDVPLEAPEVAAIPEPQLIAVEAIPTPVEESAEATEAVRAHLADDCGDPHRATQQPAVASSTSAYSRPPAMSGRFAMPGVRGVVLPGGGGSLP
jgi:hypothetical protein